MDETPMWVHTLRNELDAKNDIDKITATGEWITLMTKVLLTELSRARKVLVADILARPDWDATRLAETIGSRRTAIVRLGEEGRQIKREEEKRVGTKEGA